MASGPVDFTRSLSRSRSPRREPYRKWTISFENWATNNLDELPNPDEMFNMYRRGLRLKDKFLGELLNGTMVETPPCGSIRYWALQETRKELKKDEAAAASKIEKKHENKEKKPKKHKSRTETSEPQPSSSSLEHSHPTHGVQCKPQQNSAKAESSEPPQNSAKAESSKPLQNSAKAESSEPPQKKQKAESSKPQQNTEKPLDVALAGTVGVSTLGDVALAGTVGVSTLGDELAKAQQTLSSLEEKEDDAIEKLQQLEQSKKDMVKDKADLDKTVQRLSASVVKKNPAVKSQIQALTTKGDKLVSDIPKVEVQIESVKQSVKQVRTDIKKKEKEVASFKVLISRECAKAVTEDDPDAKSEEGPSIIEEVFEIMDRSSGGTVNKRDFIKGLENEKVSSFFKLPSKIRPEDGTRDQMESIFQKIATDGREFAIEELKSFCEQVV